MDLEPKHQIKSLPRKRSVRQQNTYIFSVPYLAYLIPGVGTF